MYWNNQEGARGLQSITHQRLQNYNKHITKSVVNGDVDHSHCNKETNISTLGNCTDESGTHVIVKTHPNE